MNKTRMLLAAATATVAATILGSPGVAQAAPGIATIGPGYSDNAEGVKCIQSALGVVTTGTYGNLTYAAVKDFQRTHGLTVDGAVGASTGEKLIPLAPDGCVEHMPSISSEQGWVASPTPGTPVSPVADTPIDEVTDKLLFDSSMDEFVAAKDARLRGAELDWTDDGCSVPLGPIWKSEPGLFDFSNACARHDFGYRNYKDQGRFTEDNRERIDKRLKKDMEATCNKSKGVRAVRGVECRKYSDAYYQAVRKFG